MWSLLSCGISGFMFFSSYSNYKEAKKKHEDLISYTEVDGEVGNRYCSGNLEAETIEFEDKKWLNLDVLNINGYKKKDPPKRYAYINVESKSTGMLMCNRVNIVNLIATMNKMFKTDLKMKFIGKIPLDINIYKFTFNAIIANEIKDMLGDIIKYKVGPNIMKDESPRWQCYYYEGWEFNPTIPYTIMGKHDGKIFNPENVIILKDKTMEQLRAESQDDVSKYRNRSMISLVLAIGSGGAYIFSKIN
jgi:hypothetical protein